MELNADLGEGMGMDEAIMPFIQSCNVACGGHTGDENSMKETIGLAKKYQVKIGAHPSYPDPVNFGRKPMHLDNRQLKESILTQIQNLCRLLEKEGLSLHHIKAHGALYLDAAKDEDIAGTLVSLVKNHYPDSFLFVPFGSVLAGIAKSGGIKFKVEGFADRNYLNDGNLVPRSHPEAVLSSSEDVLKHVHRMIHRKEVKCLDGTILPIRLDTLCVHGDNPQALQLVRSLSGLLPHFTPS